MQVQARQAPSYAVARLVLSAEESVRLRAAAMLATSYGVSLIEHESSGLWQTLIKVTRIADDSGLSTFVAPQQGGWIDVAPALPGELHVIEMDGSHGWCLPWSCWLASANSVEMRGQWQGFQNLFGGEPGFLAHVTGQGSVVVSAYGAVELMRLQPGEVVTMNPGHVLGYPDNMQSRLRSASQSGPQSMKTGEGLVFDFAGPGHVLCQTRSAQSLAAWLRHEGIRAS